MLGESADGRDGRGGGAAGGGQGLGRKVELLGEGLDYEIEGLRARVEEVEDGVLEFERAVAGIETRVGELVGNEKRNSRSGSAKMGKKRPGWAAFWSRLALGRNV